VSQKSRHSREGGNPEKNNCAKTFILLKDKIRLDARLRGHDELRHSLFPKGGNISPPLKKGIKGDFEVPWQLLKKNQ
jgi:hypothetical protein